MDSYLLPVSNDGLFYTLQGEGKTIGKPSIFLRLSFCNLRCSFCDAYYTWQPEYVNHKEPPVYMTISEILFSFQKLNVGHNNLNFVITGGEPLLFMESVTELVKNLLSFGTVEIETNGTKRPNSFLLENVQFNVSPKLSNNNADSKSRRIIPNSIKTLLEAKNVQFKFVISSEKDVDEMLEDYIYEFDIPSNLVWLMPEGQTRKELRKTRKIVVEQSLKYGFNFTDRMQINLWGNKRAV